LLFNSIHFQTNLGFEVMNGLKVSLNFERAYDIHRSCRALKQLRDQGDSVKESKGQARSWKLSNIIPKFLYRKFREAFRVLNKVENLHQRKLSGCNQSAEES